MNTNPTSREGRPNKRTNAQVERITEIVGRVGPDPYEALLMIANGNHPSIQVPDKDRIGLYKYLMPYSYAHVPQDKAGDADEGSTRVPVMLYMPQADPDDAETVVGKAQKAASGDA